MKIVLRQLFPLLKQKVIDKLLRVQQELNIVSVANKNTLTLTFQRFIHICRQAEQNPSQLEDLVCYTLMMACLLDWEKDIVAKCLSKCGIPFNNTSSIQSGHQVELDKNLLPSAGEHH